MSTYYQNFTTAYGKICCGICVKVLNMKIMSFIKQKLQNYENIKALYLVPK